MTRKGRVDRKQAAVLGRKSHCPQRGPCDGTAARERDRPFGTAARERDRPFGTVAREGTGRSGLDRRINGFADSGSFTGLSDRVSHSREWDTAEGTRDILGGTFGDRERERGPRLGCAVPSGVRCPVASPAGLHDRTRLLGGGMSMGIAGMSRCPVGMTGHGHGTSERTRVRS